jgi:hypothetical protein
MEKSSFFKINFNNIFHSTPKSHTNTNITGPKCDTQCHCCWVKRNLLVAGEVAGILPLLYVGCMTGCPRAFNSSDQRFYEEVTTSLYLTCPLLFLSCELKSLNRTLVTINACLKLVICVLEGAVFWVVAPCSLVYIDRHCRGVYYLHHQGVTFQKTAPYSSS